MGRDQQLAALRDAYRALKRQQEPQTVFISGRSGEGKTTLGEHFLASLRQETNLAVMTGRCYDRESVPFKALDSLIDALASYLLVELVGCFDPESSHFEAVPLNELLGRKLGRLPREAGHLLEVVAVSGQALPLEEASRTAGHASLPIATITRMRNERLVRLVGPDERPLVDTYHDRVRETILGGLDEQSRKSIHKTLAEIIEADAGAASEELQAGLESWRQAGERDEKPIERVYDLAYHFDAAGEARKAWIYAILFKQGFLDRSCALYANGLRRLGHWVPRSSLGFGFGVFGELVIQFVHGLRRGSLHRKAPSSRLDLAGLFLTRLSAAYAFQNSLKLLWAQFCGMNRGELVPPSSQLAFTYAGHSCVMSMLGWRARGARYGDLSIEIARQFDDLWVQAQTFNYKGIGLYASA